MEDINSTKEGFYQIAGFPNVVGTIDGTQVAIIAPSGENEPLFVCRKGFHSINVQATADSKLRLTSVLAKFPGSAHDSYILQQSGVTRKMVEDRMTGSKSVLLGDSGYPLKTWLMVPFTNPNSRAEERYNNAHKRTRCTVERAFGVLKSRFRCIHHKSGGCLMYVPQKCVNIIIAVCKLHNLCITNNLPLPEVEPDDIEDHNPVNQNPHVQNLNATTFRNNLVRQRFVI
ncbi:hypothetical protein SNE40_003689 [Patella caerulea]|uniref:DDE Tnp4 domain-containing protein n=2 Tax=Patella caerulea TaxID=87958 RepID=A0AAN8Q127_PATCE